MKKTLFLHRMSNDQLKKRLKQLRGERMRSEGRNTVPSNMRESRGDVKILHRIKKEVARIYTILSERERRHKK